MAFSGVLITLYLQREAMKRSEQEHSQNTKLTALAALLGVYHDLADKKHAEFKKYEAAPEIPGATGQIEEKLYCELAQIWKTRDSIYLELEKAAGLK